MRSSWVSDLVDVRLGYAAQALTMLPGPRVEPRAVRALGDGRLEHAKWEWRSVPGTSQRVWPRLTSHAVVALCAFVLLSGSLDTSAVQAATALGDRYSSGRRSQSYFESAMLSADAAVAGTHAQMRITKRALKQGTRAITHAKGAHRDSTAIVRQRSAHLAELEARYAGVPPEGIPGGFAGRRRSVRRDVARAKAHRQAVGRQFRAAIRARSARQSRLNVLRRSLRSAVLRRESAEGGLGAYIVQLTRLAAQRADDPADAQLSVSSSSFTWPSVGRISQTYGCTGVSYEPPRGSCRHFHDGLDIVAGYGSRTDAAADGVVAYAGWNPWDAEGRAWIMVVSHPDGYVTRYGHLIPGVLARVGQFVRQGEAIGKMGITGNSTGTHLHFELLRDNTTVDPWAYLPAGMVTMKPAKRHGGHGKGKHKRGGKGARDGQRQAGSGAALDGEPPPASDAPPNGQIFGVDLALPAVLPAVAAAPTVACAAASGTMSGDGDRARGTRAMGRREGPSTIRPKAARVAEPTMGVATPARSVSRVRAKGASSPRPSGQRRVVPAAVREARPRRTPPGGWSAVGWSAGCPTPARRSGTTAVCPWGDAGPRPCRPEAKPGSLALPARPSAAAPLSAADDPYEHMGRTLATAAMMPTRGGAGGAEHAVGGAFWHRVEPATAARRSRARFAEPSDRSSMADDRSRECRSTPVPGALRYGSRECHSNVPSVKARGRRTGVSRSSLAALLLVGLLAVSVVAPSMVAAASLKDQIAAAKERQASLTASIAKSERLVDELKRDEQATRDALAATKEELTHIRADTAAVKEHIEQVGARLDRIEEHHAELVDEQRQTDFTLGLLEQELANGEEDLKVRRQALGRRLAEAHRAESTTLLEQVFTAESFSDVLTDTSAYLAYGDQDAQLARQITQDQQALDGLRLLTTSTRLRTDQLRRETLDTQARVEELRAALREAKAAPRRARAQDREGARAPGSPGRRHRQHEEGGAAARP